jgi:hypothetical protein
LAQDGFTPTFAPAADITVASPTTQGAAVLRGLTFDNARIDGRAGDGNLALSVLESTFVQHNADAISVTNGDAGTPDEVSLLVASCEFTITNTGGNEGSAIQVANFAINDVLGLSIQDNTVSISGGDTRGALSVYSVDVPLASLFVRHNEIHRAGTAGGMFLSKESAGAWSASILNNLIAGTPGSSYPALDLADAAAQGTYEAGVHDNTFATGDDAVVIASSVSGLFANNIVANFSGSGLDVGAGSPFENRFNLFWDASVNVAAGSGTVLADPLFVGGGNYRLAAESPARNVGDNSAVPAQVAIDLDGNPRIGQDVVDLGAYETLGSVLEIPTLSEVALAALAALLGIVGALLLRRNQAPRLS